MTPKDFLDKLNIELKISKNSEYTLRNYLKANNQLFDFTKKNPEQITNDDVKKYIAENLAEKSSQEKRANLDDYLSKIKKEQDTLMKQKEEAKEEAKEAEPVKEEPAKEEEKKEKKK